MRILTPTENKRINEMIGFVGLSLAVLLALSLLSYSPHDASFNVAERAPASRPAYNWIGPVGAHISDLFFQFCGFSAFLFPVAMILVALRWFRSQLLEAPVAKLIGSAMVLSSLSAGMVLLHFPDVRGAVPSGGLLGTVLAGHVRRGWREDRRFQAEKMSERLSFLASGRFQNREALAKFWNAHQRVAQKRRSCRR